MTRALLLVVVVAVSLVGCTTGGEVSRTGPEASTPAALGAREGDAHLQVAIAFSPAGLKHLTSARVEGPVPKFRSQGQWPWRLEVRDASGALVHEAGLPAATALRGEFQGEGGKTEGSHLLVGEGAFSVTTPVVVGTLRILARPDTLPATDPRSKGTEWVVLGELPVPVEAK